MSSDDDAAAHALKKAGTGKVAFKKLDSTAKSEYWHGKYEARKNDQSKQDAMMEPYLYCVENPAGWLTKDALRGWHCRLCFGKTIKASDKLSTVGYGWSGSGNARILVAVTSAQKLITHQKCDQHRYHVK